MTTVEAIDATVLVVGRGVLIDALARRLERSGIEVTLSASDGVEQAARVAAPDLLIVAGDSARSEAERVLSRLGRDASTAALPVLAICGSTSFTTPHGLRHRHAAELAPEGGVDAWVARVEKLLARLSAGGADEPLQALVDGIASKPSPTPGRGRPDKAAPQVRVKHPTMVGLGAGLPMVAPATAGIVAPQPAGADAGVEKAVPAAVSVIAPPRSGFGASPSPAATPREPIAATQHAEPERTPEPEPLRAALAASTSPTASAYEAAAAAPRAEPEPLRAPRRAAFAASTSPAAVPCEPVAAAPRAAPEPEPREPLRAPDAELFVQLAVSAPPPELAAASSAQLPPSTPAAEAAAVEVSWTRDEGSREHTPVAWDVAAEPSGPAPRPAASHAALWWARVNGLLRRIGPLPRRARGELVKLLPAAERLRERSARAHAGLAVGAACLLTAVVVGLVSRGAPSSGSNHTAGVAGPAAAVRREAVRQPPAPVHTPPAPAPVARAAASTATRPPAPAAAPVPATPSEVAANDADDADPDDADADDSDTDSEPEQSATKPGRLPRAVAIKLGRANRHVDAGRKLFARGHLGLAEAEYIEALHALPRFPRALTGLVKVHLRRKDGVEALRWARRLISRQPHFGVNQLLLGDALALNGDRAGADKAWHKAVRYGCVTARKRLAKRR